MKRNDLQKPRWQRLMLPLVVLAFALNAAAAEPECKWSLQLWNVDDDVPIQTLSFADFEPTVTFGDNQLIITTKFLEIDFFDLNEIRKITYLYEDGSGINDIVAEKATMKFNGEDIVFTALEKGTDISVYAANGMLMMKKNVANAGDCTLSLSRLSQGVYVISVNGQTFKIVKK